MSTSWIEETLRFLVQEQERNNDKTGPQHLAVCFLKYGGSWCISCSSHQVALLRSWKLPWDSAAPRGVFISCVQEAVSFLSAFHSAVLKAKLHTGSFST